MADCNETNRPLYHKDRLYTHSPPAGVSTGLGYLGNGSGAVMPVEINVSTSSLVADRSKLTSHAVHARQRKPSIDR